MDYKQQLNTWFSNFEHRFDEAVPVIVSETATEFFQKRFETQEWDGTPWPALNTKYAAKKTRGAGQILTKNGFLKASIRPSEVTANRVVISAGNAKVPYARAHNEGLKINGIANVRGYTNKNFMGKGKRVQIKPHTRSINFKMPQRKFMGNSKFLNQAIIDRLTKAFNS
ncbi:phage virion morphogenesis protein [Leeuwenhoekiella aequorea]|uniref:phage virion morphogenesis protein n=1 Tax=Leeuwenhoekiella aequorea TaxID=283736 RepID=UPI00352F4DC7|tara:strand:- start:12865 stop:13371 length:507 start_codon:yes stop_codon:yes gene_type:complete